MHRGRRQGGRRLDLGDIGATLTGSPNYE
jgi:hypothetical protein